MGATMGGSMKRNMVGRKLGNWESACEKMKNRYVLMRTGNPEQEIESENRNRIPITVRQLEAIVRIAESIAKMQLKPFATEVYIDEAMRLFQVSTLEAARSENFAEVEVFTTTEDHDLLRRLESQLKRRFAIGSQVSKHMILGNFILQKYTESAIMKVIQTLVRRGNIQYRMQRKLLFRIK